MVSLTVIAGCGGDGQTLGDAFCADIKDGQSPFQVLAPSVRNGTYEPQEAARLAYGWAASDCPDELRTNDALRSYLEGFDINPDA